jgi:hypothetical protein
MVQDDKPQFPKLAEQTLLSLLSGAAATPDDDVPYWLRVEEDTVFDDGNGKCFSVLVFRKEPGESSQPLPSFVSLSIVRWDDDMFPEGVTSPDAQRCARDVIDSKIRETIQMLRRYSSEEAIPRA